MSDIYQTMNFLSEDLDAMERAAKAAGSSSIPANLRLSLLKTLGKLMKILDADEYPYPKPEGYEKPAYPEPTKREHSKVVTDRERTKAVKIRFVDKSAKVAEAEKVAMSERPAHFDRTPVTAEQYSILAQQFGNDFAARYYVASAAKSGDGDWPKENTWDNLVRPSAETLAERARAKAQQVEIERRIAAEEAERRRQTAGFASYWNSPS